MHERRGVKDLNIGSATQDGTFPGYMRVCCEESLGMKRDQCEITLRCELQVGYISEKYICKVFSETDANRIDQRFISFLVGYLFGYHC